MSTLHIILIISVLGQISDVATTWCFLQIGLVEGNPVWGTDPDLFLVSVFKVLIIIGVMCGLKKGMRIGALSFSAFAGWGAGIWNFSNILLQLNVL